MTSAWLAAGNSLREFPKKNPACAGFFVFCSEKYFGFEVMRSIFLLLTLIALAACGAPPADRHAGPDSALVAARQALHRHDISGYFDALTDRAVRTTLYNSIGLCNGAADPKGQNWGAKVATQCASILRAHGWTQPTIVTDVQAYKNAIAAIADPRSLAADLEKLYRDAGHGGSFVWAYLDAVEVGEVARDGSRAVARVIWTGVKREGSMEFVQDSSGWRLDPFPDLSMLDAAR